MQAKHSLEFARAPAVWSMYPKIMVSRKPTLVADGAAVPRIEARLSRVVIDRKHLAAYSDVCGASTGPTLPIAYPHVLAMPLHLAMLGAEAFPVRLFGLVHVQNRIAMRQPLSAEEPAEIRAWIEGHRDTERGQEFDLHTEYVVAGEALWDETCTFLARKRPPPGASKPVSRAVEGAPDAVAIKSSSFRAPSGLGRRYGFISGDVNPIHMSDLTARAFGFPRAIAHGMWSLGRTRLGLRSRTVRRRLRAVGEFQTADLHAFVADAATLVDRERFGIRPARRAGRKTASDRNPEVAAVNAAAPAVPVGREERRALLAAAAACFCLIGGYYMLRPIREALALEVGVSNNFQCSWWCSRSPRRCCPRTGGWWDVSRARA